MTNINAIKDTAYGVVDKIFSVIDLFISIGFFSLDLLVVFFSNFFENMIIFFMLFELFIMFVAISGSNFIGDRRQTNILFTIVNYHVSIFWFIVWTIEFMKSLVLFVVEVISRIVQTLRNLLPIP